MESALCYILVFGLLLVGPAASARKKPKRPNKWGPTSATFYGAIDGDGSSGGACAYGPLVDARPYMGRATAVSDVLFKNGRGCGACYKIMCLDKDICSKKPTPVVVIDQSPGGKKTHFDLSGLAFARLARKGSEATLRNRGFLTNDTVVYKRVNCRYRHRGVTLRVSEGSTNDWFSLLVTYVNGPGVFKSMEIKSKEKCNYWQKMKHVWGVIYFATTVGEGPYSIRLNTTRKSLTLKNVIPKKWALNHSYSLGSINF